MKFTLGGKKVCNSEQRNWLVVIVIFVRNFLDKPFGYKV